MSWLLVRLHTSYMHENQTFLLACGFNVHWTKLRPFCEVCVVRALIHDCCVLWPQKDFNTRDV